MRQLSQAKTWFESTYVVGSAKVISAPSARVRRRLRLHSGAATLRVRALVEEPHGAAEGPGSGGGGGSISRPTRQSSIRWARRQQMLPSEPRPEAGGDDIFELNVGGKLMQTTRSTLQVVAGSRLAMMFRKGGEGELSYDSKGRVWLDWDPSLFQLVLRYLRGIRMNRGNRQGCLPAVQPADEAPFRRLFSYLGLLPYAGAPIPIAIGNDPLSDLLPPPPQPVHPHAAVAAVSALQSPLTPPSAAASLDCHNRQQSRQQHQNKEEEKRTKRPRAANVDSHRNREDGDDSSRVEGGPRTATAAAAAPKPSKRAEATDGLGAEPGGNTGPRGIGTRKSGSLDAAPISDSADAANGIATDGSEGLGALAGPPGQVYCKKTNSPQSARKRSSNSSNAHQHQHPHQHNSNSQNEPPSQQHQQQQQQQHPFGSSQAPQRCSNNPTNNQQNHNQLAQEPQLESKDFIPDTATCSILSSVRSTRNSSSGAGAGGSCSSARNIGSGSGVGYKSGDWQQHERAGSGRHCSSSSSSPPSFRQHDDNTPTSQGRTSTSASSPGDGAAPAGSRLGGRQPAEASSRCLPPRRVGGGGGASDRTMTKLSPPPIRNITAVSQLFYISAEYKEMRGLRVTVHTEDDVRAAAAAVASASTSAQAGQTAEPFDIFIDTTYGEGQISLTFVSRRELLPGGVFLGLTSRAQLDRKGAQIPCYGWKSNGCTYNDHTGGWRLGGGGGGGGSSKVGSSAVTAKSDGASCQVPEKGRLYDTAGEEPSEQQPLWQKGDSVELIMRQGQQHNQLLLKVNGQAIDVINRLPSFRHWSWYVGLWAGGDINCAVFQRDQYAVYWGDYAVKRYL